MAVHESFHTPVAQVAEIALDGKGGLRVERVVCAVDCGVVINPDIVKAQMEGGVGFGLSAFVYGDLNLDQGVVRERNFDTYRVLRIDEMPKVEVHIVDSRERPTGVGEPGVPPVAPAIANAYLAATGKVFRRLPVQRNERQASL